MKQMKNWLRKQREDWQEFAAMIGLKNNLQQMAVGAALCLGLLMACGLGEWLNSFIK